jgi:diguanylate cyclase (GGDEF)-like protein
VSVGQSRRFRATQRRRTATAARAGFVVIAIAVGFDAIALVGLGEVEPVVPLLDAFVIGTAIVGWWLLPRNLRHHPELVAWVVATGLTISTAATGLSAPSLFVQNAAYMLLLPSLVALVLPWRTSVHLRWLLVFAIVATAYLVLAPANRLPGSERGDLTIVVFVGLGASLAGHALLQRAQIRSFAQLEKIKALHRQADKDMEELERVHHALELTARIDPLTGAGNRRRLDEDLRAVRAHIHRSGMTYGLLEIDLDRFKIINDTLGHLAGDDVLRRVVEAIQGTLRATDAAYRYGGEEFVVILPVPNREGLITAAERLRTVVLDLVIEHPDNPGVGIVSVSIGATLIGSFNLNLSNEGWFELTDRALYEAKRGGRNRVEYVTEIA